MIIIDKQVLTDLAKHVRRGLDGQGIALGHARCLEAVTAALGFRDVNAATAVLEQRPILVGIPAQPTRATETILAEVGNPRWSVGVNLGRLLARAGVALDAEPENIRQRVAEACMGLPYLGSAMSLEQEAKGLRAWLELNPMPDTSWAGMETMELAEQVGSASERLETVTTLLSELRGWEDGTLYRPDVALDVTEMRDRLVARLALRDPRQLAGLQPHDARAVLTGALREVVLAEPGDQAEIRCLGEGVQDSLADAVTLDGSCRDGEGGWRWSVIDVAVEALGKAVAPVVRHPSRRAELHAMLQATAPEREGARVLQEQADRAAMVPAQIGIDDEFEPVEFNASPFLGAASLEQILALAACGWRGDYPADDVAWHVRGMYGYAAVDALLTRVENEGKGFEVSVDEAEARRWLALVRPEVAAALPPAEPDEEAAPAPRR